MKKSIYTIFRVIRLSDSFRESLRQAREAKGTTNATFIAETVGTHLPKIVESLRTLGFLSDNGPKRPARLPFLDSAGTLRVLRNASQETGIPATRLLIACLVAATQARPRKRRRRARGRVVRA